MAFPRRFLIDECVSPTLASKAQSHGFDAWHVIHRGLNSQPDYRIFKACQAEDLILVTNNRRDFLPLYAGAEIHAGLVIILPNVDRHEQQRLFGIVLDWLGRQADIVNRVIEIGADGFMRISELPRAQS